MPLNLKRARFVLDAGLQNHLANNGDTLSELLAAIGDQTAISALSNLLGGDVCCGTCQAKDVSIVVECLCGACDVPDATRPDFDAAVRWQGAQMSDFHSILAT